MKPLYFKENHCGSCAKVFCCFNCKLKHENIAHHRKKPSHIRKSLVLNQSKLSNSSLSKTQELVQSKNSKSNHSKNSRKRSSVHIYEDKSPFLLTKKRMSCNENKPDEIKDDTLIESVANCTSEILKRDIESEKNSIISEKAFDDDKNVKNSTSELIDEEGKKENFPPLNIQNFDRVTVRIHPSKKPPEYDDISETTVSVIETNSSLDESSSIRRVYSENTTENKSENDQKWRTALTNFCDSSTNELKGNSENSSIYYACSESLTEVFQNKKFEKKGIEKSEVDSKHPSSTHLEVTISFVRQLESKTSRIDSPLPCTLLSEEGLAENEIISISDSTQTDTYSETTISAIESTQSFVNFGDCSSINMESYELPSKPPQEFLDKWAGGVCLTQSRNESTEDDETRESNFHLIEQISLPIAKTTFTAPTDKSFWQSFSNSLQRAYNSTKQMCNNIGRKNKSKRDVDDVEEQPRPKRQKVLCRPPIRENPKVLFTYDGDIRRPVIAFDKGTQTDW